MTTAATWLRSRTYRRALAEALAATADTATLPAPRPGRRARPQPQPQQEPAAIIDAEVPR
jgi:hypothetical protein